MADTNEKVLALVEAELKKNPDASTQELQDAAKKKYPEAGELTKRQFNARYALQIKRRKPGTGDKPKAAKKSAASRAGAAVKKAATRTRSAARRTRKPATPAPAAAPATAASAPDRDAIRGQFLRFATEITAAGERKDLVRVLASVDKYVDAVVKASGA